MKLKIILFGLLCIILSYVFLEYKSNGDEKNNYKEKVNKTISFFNFTKSLRKVYDIKFISDILINMSNSKIAQKIDFNGLLNVRIMENSKKIIALMQFSSLKISSSNENMDTLFEKLYSDIFVVEFLKNGKIIDITYKYKKEDYASLDDLFSTIQVILEDKKNYTKIEESTSGEFNIRYTRLNAFNKINKKKTKFTSFNSEQKMKIVNSNIDFTINNDWIVDVFSKNKYKIYQNSSHLMTADNTIVLNKTDIIDESLEIWKFKGSYKDILSKYSKTSHISFVEQKTDEIKKKIYKKNKTTFDIMLNNIKSNMDIRNIQELEEYLRLNPSKIALLYPVFLYSSDEMQSVYINVFENIGSPKAQKQLLKILDNEDVKQLNHLRVLFAFNGIEKPTIKSVDYLWKVYDERELDLSNTSILALGTLSSKMSNTNNSYNDIQERIRSEYNANINNNRKIRAILLSMQNAKIENFENEILSIIKNTSNRKVKSVAIKTLEGLDKKKVKEKMLRVLQTSNDSLIKASVMDTLKSISSNKKLISQVQNDIFKQDDSLVRKKMIKYLLKYKKTYPENITILKKLHKLERNTENQKLLIRNLYK